MDPAELIANADVALYRAKQTGRARAAPYGPEMHTASFEVPSRAGTSSHETDNHRDCRARYPARDALAGDAGQDRSRNAAEISLCRSLKQANRTGPEPLRSTPAASGRPGRCVVVRRWMRGTAPISADPGGPPAMRLRWARL
jgi:hypothetical protein